MILDAIHGSDPLDTAAVDQPFAWPPPASFNLAGLKIGYVDDPQRPADRRDDLQTLRSLGFDPVAIKLPENLPVNAVTLMLGTEAAAVFDELTRKHITEGLNTWPATFRQGQFVPAVEYLRAARVRTLLMRAMDEVMAKVDVYVGGGLDLQITNLTGHPTAVVPSGFRERDGREMPGSVTFTGRLFDETTLVAVARAYQQAKGDNLRRPPLDRFLAEA